MMERLTLKFLYMHIPSVHQKILRHINILTTFPFIIFIFTPSSYISVVIVIHSAARRKRRMQTFLRKKIVNMNFLMTLFQLRYSFNPQIYTH